MTASSSTTARRSTADAVKQNIEAWRKGRLLGVRFTNIADHRGRRPLTVRSPPWPPWPEFAWLLYLDGRFGIVAPAQLDSPRLRQRT